MNLLTAEHVSKSFTEKFLFEDVSFGIGEGDKIGLIGVNGTGKSTLLKVLAGLEEPDGGKVTKGNQVKVEYLPQNPEFDLEAPVLSYVTVGRQPKNENWNLEGEARAMLVKLGIEDPDVPAGQLSGGQRKRAALVRALLGDAELLILDEPTNHLDSAMAAWLEEYLKRRRTALLMITHDRYFLDQVTNRILELSHGKLYEYAGGYENFLERKAERAELERAGERKQAALFKQDLAWMRRGARARSTKQKAHIARFEALRDRERLQEDSQVEIGSVSSRLGRTTLELEGLSKAYGSHVLFQDFTYTFLKQDRIGIIGHNGCGKSTLLKIIMGQVEPDAGKVTVGQTVKIGYFSQENEEMDPAQTVLDSVKDIAEYLVTEEGSISASKMLERFLFEGGVQYAPIGKLSGGERRRLALLHILMGAPNILILDEPTNDLDIETLSILEDFLDRFKGIVIAVSHDRYFLDRVVSRIFAFGEGGAVRQYEGGYSDYLERVEEEPGGRLISGVRMPGKAGEAGQPENSSGAASWKAQRKKKLRFSYKEEREYEAIDGDIAALEQRIGELTEEIGANAADYGKLVGLTAQKEAAEAELAQKLERWVYLNELAEQIEAQRE